MISTIDIHKLAHEIRLERPSCTMAEDEQGRNNEEDRKFVQLQYNKKKTSSVGIQGKIIIQKNLQYKQTHTKKRRKKIGGLSMIILIPV